MERFQEVARLHSHQIHHGILPLFGARFLSRLYYRLASSSRAAVWVVIEDEKVVGFLAGCADIRQSYRSVFARSGLQLSWLALRSVFKPSVFRRLPSVFVYPFQLGKKQTTEESSASPVRRAELLSIAIDDGCHGRGFGRQLILEFEKELLRWGINEPYWVTTNCDDMNSNAFYRALGFEARGTFKHHSLILQRYCKDVYSIRSRE
jgi:ribosomal protein S18 acetylase RimI-like enzyme